MITINQIKAARALLGWKQSDLAREAHVAIATLAAWEQNKSIPRDTTIRLITKALEDHGIEFTPEPGVRLRREKFSFSVLEGYESILEVWKDIKNEVPPGGECMIAGVDERIWFQKYKDDFKSMLRDRKRDNIVTRILIREGDTLLTNLPERYRAIPDYLFQQTPYYVYADRVAIINWGPPQFVLLIRNALIAETFRRQFEFNWQIGKMLDTANVVIASIDD